MAGLTTAVPQPEWESILEISVWFPSGNSHAARPASRDLEVKIVLATVATMERARLQRRTLD